MITTPPYLQPGDTIGLVCPAGYMPLEKATECIRVLQEEWGYHVKVGATVGSNSLTYFSGTDEERLIDFQLMLDDDEVKAVLCARGGYGMGRIIDKVNFKNLKRTLNGSSATVISRYSIHTFIPIITFHRCMPHGGRFQ